jgi:hypothetical protein
MLASFARRAPFTARSVFGVALLISGTDQAAYQDLVSLFVHHPSIVERARTLTQSVGGVDSASSDAGPL